MKRRLAPAAVLVACVAAAAPRCNDGNAPNKRLVSKGGTGRLTRTVSGWSLRLTVTRNKLPEGGESTQIIRLHVTWSQNRSARATVTATYDQTGSNPLKCASRFTVVAQPTD